MLLSHQEQSRVCNPQLWHYFDYFLDRAKMGYLSNKDGDEEDKTTQKLYQVSFR